MDLYGSSVTGSAVRPTSPKGVVRISSKNDVLQHYGVPGQKWGVITKEYQPVAIDRRKLKRPTPSTNAFNKTFRPPESKNQKLMSQKPNAGWSSKKYGDRNKKLRRAAYIGAAAIGLITAYGTYKYIHTTKAKAYSGILQRFLSQNPGANMATESGRQLLQKGQHFAEMNSKTLKTAKLTNGYLNRKGLNVASKEARRIYSSRRLINRVSKIPIGKNKFMRAVNRFRASRLRSRILNKIFF